MASGIEGLCEISENVLNITLRRSIILQKNNEKKTVKHIEYHLDYWQEWI
jgi:hypothetical protein